MSVQDIIDLQPNCKYKFFKGCWDNEEALSLDDIDPNSPITYITIDVINNTLILEI